MKILTIVAVTVLSSVAMPQAPEMHSQEEARALAESAMKLIAKDNIAEAFALLRPYVPMPESEYSVLRDKTIEQRKLLAPRFGKTLGYVFVSERKLSDFAVKYVFVEKRASHIVRWQFIFYKPLGVWKLDTFLWDDQFAALFD